MRIFLRFVPGLLFFLVTWMAVPAQHVSFRHLDVTDGLPGSNIYCVHQDQRGFLWFGTEAGLSRYDGKSFRTFTVNDGLPDNEVLGLFEDSQQRLWLLTYNGIPGFLRNDSIFNSENTPFLSECTPHAFTSHIWESPEGDIYLNSGILYRITGINSGNPQSSIIDLTEAMVLRFIEPGRVQTIMKRDIYEIDSVGKHKIVGTSPRRFYRVRDKSLSLKNGNLLLSARRDLMLWAGDKWSQIGEPFPDRIISLYQDPAGKTWVGTMSGAFELDAEMQIQDTFLSGIPVSDVHMDVEGNLWLTTVGFGVYCTANPTATTWGAAEDMESMNCLSVGPEGQVWAGGKGQRLFRFNGNNAEVIRLDPNRKVSNEHWLQNLVWGPDGRIYGGGDGETFAGRPGKVDALSMKALKDVVKDPQDRIWAAYPYGVWHLNDSFITEMSVSSFEHRKKLVAGDGPGYTRPITLLRSTALAVDSNGVVYIGTHTGVLRATENTGGDWEVKQDSSLPMLGISDLHFDSSGHLWGATVGKGVFSRQGDSTVWVGHEEGVPEYSVQRMFLESDSAIWAATHSGLLYMGKENDKWQTRVFGKAEGLASAEVRDVIAYRDTIWIATAGGLTRIPRKDILSVDLPPRLHLSSVEVMGQSVDQDAPLNLKHFENRVNIHFTALDFNTRGKVQYRYRLLGLDESWSLGYARDVSYNSLAAGQYLFEVQCRRDSGDWSEKQSLSFHIARPWWKELWFWVLSGFFYVGLVWLVFYFRLRRVRRKSELEKRVLQSEQKALRAQMNPHFIFNALNSVQHFFLNQRPREGNSYLNKFSGLIRKILENSDQMYLSIEEELQMIRPYLDFEQLRSGDKFDFELEIDETIDRFNTLIPGMLIQPLLENAIWHGIRHRETKGLIRLEIKEKSHGISIQVIDNGVGREEAAKRESNERKEHRSMGLKLIRDRIEVVNALGNDRLSIKISDIAVAESLATGTLVEINIDTSKNDRKE